MGGAYSGDIGIGYASVIHSESEEKIPEKQASLAIFGIFLDTFIVCTLTLFLILITGVWKEDVPASLMVQLALAKHFSHLNYFMPLFLFLLGYSTMLAFFHVGLKSAHYLSNKHGKKLYIIYAIIALITFSFFPQENAYMLMTFSGGLLILINVISIFRLRKEISFKIWSEKPSSR